MQRKIPPELDFTSNKFNPKKFLYSNNIHLACKKAKTYDNLTDWYNHTFGKKKSDNPQTSHKKASKNEYETLKRDFKWYYGTLGLNIPRNFDEARQYSKSFKRRKDQYGRIKQVNVKVVAPETLQPLRSNKVTIIRTNNITSDNYFLKIHDTTSKNPLNKLSFELNPSPNKMTENNIKKVPEVCCPACAEIEALCSLELSENDFLDQSKVSLSPNSVTETVKDFNLDHHDANKGLCSNNDEHIKNEMSKEILVDPKSKFEAEKSLPEIAINQGNATALYNNHGANQAVKNVCETDNHVEKKAGNLSDNSKFSMPVVLSNNVNILNDLFKRTFKSNGEKLPLILNKGKFNTDVGSRTDTEFHYNNRHKVPKNKIYDASAFKLDKAEHDAVINTASDKTLQKVHGLTKSSKVDMSSDSSLNISNKHCGKKSNQQKEDKTLLKIEPITKTEFENDKAARVSASYSSVTSTNSSDFKTSKSETFQSSKKSHNSETIDAQKTAVKSNNFKQFAISNADEINSDVIYTNTGSYENRNKVTKTKMHDASREKSDKVRCDIRSNTVSEQIMLDTNVAERPSKVNMSSNSLLTAINDTDSGARNSRDIGKEKSSNIESSSVCETLSRIKKVDGVSASSGSSMKFMPEDSSTSNKHSIPIEPTTLSCVKITNNYSKKLHNSKTADDMNRNFDRDAVEQALVANSSMSHKKDIDSNNDKIVYSVSKETHPMAKCDTRSKTTPGQTIRELHDALTPPEINFSSDACVTVEGTVRQDSAQKNNCQKRIKIPRRTSTFSDVSFKSPLENLYSNSKNSTSTVSPNLFDIESSSYKIAQCLKKSHNSETIDVQKRTSKCNETKQRLNLPKEIKSLTHIVKENKVAETEICNVSEEKPYSTASEQVIQGTHGVMRSTELKASPNVSLTAVNSEKFGIKNNLTKKNRKSKKLESILKSEYESKKARISDSSSIKSSVEHISIKDNVKLYSNEKLQCLKKSYNSKRDDVLKRTLKYREAKPPQTLKTEFNPDVAHKMKAESLAKGSTVADTKPSCISKEKLCSTVSEKGILCAPDVMRSSEVNGSPNSSITSLSNEKCDRKSVNQPRIPEEESCNVSTKTSNPEFSSKKRCAVECSKSVYENKKPGMSPLSDVSMKSNHEDSFINSKNSTQVFPTKSNDAKDSIMQKSCTFERDTGSNTISKQILQDKHGSKRPSEVKENPNSSTTVVTNKESVEKSNKPKRNRTPSNVDSNSETLCKNTSNITKSAIPALSDSSIKSVDDFASKLKLKRKSPLNESKRIPTEELRNVLTKTSKPEPSGKKRRTVEDISHDRKIPKTESCSYSDANLKLDNSYSQGSKVCDELQTNGSFNASDSSINELNLKGEKTVKNGKGTSSPKVCSKSNSSGNCSAMDSSAKISTVKRKNDNGSVKVCTTPEAPDNLVSKEKSLLELARRARSRVSTQSPQ